MMPAPPRNPARFRPALIGVLAAGVLVAGVPVAVHAQLDLAALGGMDSQAAAGLVLDEVYAFDERNAAGVHQIGIQSHTSLTEMTNPTGMGDEVAMELKERIACIHPDNLQSMMTWYATPANELTARVDQASEDGLDATATELTVAAVATAAEASQINDRLRAGGVPVDLFAAVGAPMQNQMGMNITNPADYLGMMSIFLLAGADARAQAENPTRTSAACAEARARLQAKEQFRYAGAETVDGIETAVVEVTGLDHSQQIDNDTRATFNKVSLAVNAAIPVPIRTRIEGVVEQDGESRPIGIEKRELDYRPVAGSNMIASHRQVMAIDGWNAMGPEAAEAQAQLAELEAQLASIPESQRVMMERMLGNQLDTIRKMAGGGPIEVEVIVDRILVNPGIPGGPPNSTLALVSSCPGMANEALLECLRAIEAQAAP